MAATESKAAPLSLGVESSKPLEDQYRSIENLLLRPSPFGNETGTLPNGEYEPGKETKDRLHDAKVLVVGAGGLGSELLKDLALMGFRNIHVTDLDTIDLTNLNRQFLFRMDDIGKDKSEVAARFVMKRVPGCTVTAYRSFVQDFDDDFFRSCAVVIGGLDNLKARTWINEKLCSLAMLDDEGFPDPDTVVPYIDGGTEGFKGHCWLILPKFTACFGCHLDMFPPAVMFQECTIASTPRQPQHCVAWVKEKLWPKERPGVKIDTDNIEHMQWIHARSLERAEEFGIEGVTYQFTMGAVKNIIPAIASTNALVSGIQALEVFKLVTFCSQSLNTYLNVTGEYGATMMTQQLERQGPGDCSACQTKVHKLAVHPESTLAGAIRQLVEDPELNILAPSLAREGKALYYSAPAFMEADTHGNLCMPMKELVQDGENTYITATWGKGPAGEPEKLADAVSMELRFQLDPSAAKKQEKDVEAPPSKSGGGGAAGAAGGGAGK